MIRLTFAIPGDLATPTGGYAYDRRVMALLPGHGIDTIHLPLPGGFPFPSKAELEETARLLGAVPADHVLMIDGLAFGAMPEKLLTGIAAPIISMLHHPLGLETGLEETESRRLLALEEAALRFARHIIVTSPATAKTLGEFSWAPPPPVTVAIPGTEPASRAEGANGTCEILSVGAVVPRKGHDLLVEALARLPHRDWHCTIAGSIERDADFAGRLIRRINEHGIQEKVHLTGPLEAESLAELYRKADIFALPSRYEGYGMAFAEALARGLPIVAARAGAVPDTVPGDAGILVPPNDAGALSDALHALISDRSLRSKLSEAAWEHGQALPRWDDTARIIARVIHEVHQ